MKESCNVGHTADSGHELHDSWTPQSGEARGKKTRCSGEMEEEFDGPSPTCYPVITDNESTVKRESSTPIASSPLSLALAPESFGSLDTDEARASSRDAENV